MQWRHLKVYEKLAIELRKKIAEAKFVSGPFIVMYFFPLNHEHVQAQQAGEYKVAKQVAVALSLYERANKGRLPLIASGRKVSSTISQYLKRSRDASPQRSLVAACDSFVWNEDLSGARQTNLFSPSQTWLFHARFPSRNHKVVVEFADFRLRYLDPQRLSEIIVSKRQLFRAAK